MVQVKISEQNRPLPEVNTEWITSTISKNRVMGKVNSVEINIESENATLDLFANCEQAGQAKASNEIEGRIIFLWKDLVLSKADLHPGAIYDFLVRMDEWVSFIPKDNSKPTTA